MLFVPLVMLWRGICGNRLISVMITCHPMQFSAGGGARSESESPKVIVVEVPPGEEVLDPALARVKQRVGEACFLKILSPEDAMEVYFEVGRPFNISFEVVCVEDELEKWLATAAPGRRGIAATVLLDADTVCNFTLPDVVQVLTASH